MNVVFFGTPEFAVPSLARLCEEPEIRVALAVTQPDRPVGRHAVPSPSPVAAEALRRNVPLLQPERLRGAADVFDRIRAERPDAIAVVAYGKIFPAELLELPPLGCVNLHASLLPRHRGASPIQAAILAGDDVTGVMTMRMAPELDVGPIYAQRRVAVGADDTSGTLSPRLAAEGADLLAETLLSLSRGTATAREQQGEPTYCRTIRRTDGKIDWSRPASHVLRMRRAYTPWPGIFTTLSGERVKVLDAREGPSKLGAPEGTIVPIGDDPAVVCGEGTSIVATLLQREGKTPVSGGEFWRGLRSFGGARFGT